MEQDTNNIPELQSPFEQLREVDAGGKEWWNSRRLARVMGYGKYWNFERVIATAMQAARESRMLVTSLTAPLPSSAISVISTKCSPR